jgi:hypothetical protein
MGYLPSTGATSEVGILVWFTDFGLVFALPMMWILFRAVVQAVRWIFFSQADITAIDLFCSIAFLTQFPNMLLQTASRILYVADVVVYCSMFYLYFSSKLASMEQAQMPMLPLTDQD